MGLDLQLAEDPAIPFDGWWGAVYVAYSPLVLTL